MSIWIRLHQIFILTDGSLELTTHTPTHKHTMTRRSCRPLNAVMLLSRCPAWYHFVPCGFHHVHAALSTQSQKVMTSGWHMSSHPTVMGSPSSKSFASEPLWRRAFDGSACDPSGPQESMLKGRRKRNPRAPCVVIPPFEQRHTCRWLAPMSWCIRKVRMY